MTMPGFSGDPHNVVYKVNIRNQRTSAVQNSEPNILSWQTDQQHRIRVGTYFKDGLVNNRVYDLNTKKWLELWPYKPFSKEQTDVIGFAKDPDIVYLQANHNGRMATFTVDLKDPKRDKTLIYSDPHYDVTGSLIYHPNSAEVIGIHSGLTQRAIYFSPPFAALQSGIDALMPKNQKSYL